MRRIIYVSHINKINSNDNDTPNRWWSLKSNEVCYLTGLRAPSLSLPLALLPQMECKYLRRNILIFNTYSITFFRLMCKLNELIQIPPIDFWPLRWLNEMTKWKRNQKSALFLSILLLSSRSPFSPESRKHIYHFICFGLMASVSSGEWWCDRKMKFFSLIPMMFHLSFCFSQINQNSGLWTKNIAFFY